MSLLLQGTKHEVRMSPCFSQISTKALLLSARNQRFLSIPQNLANNGNDGLGF